MCVFSLPGRELQQSWSRVWSTHSGPSGQVQVGMSCMWRDITIPLLLYSSCDLYSVSRKLDHILILNWPLTYVCHGTYQYFVCFSQCYFLPEIDSCVILRRTPYLESWPLFDYDYAQRSDDCIHTLCLKFSPGTELNRYFLFGCCWGLSFVMNSQLNLVHRSAKILCC